MFQRRVRNLVLVVLIGSGAAAWASLSIRGMNGWVHHETKGTWFRDIRDVSPHDVAIVPGTGFHDGRPSGPMEERLWLALTLYEAGRVRAILVSGVEKPRSREASGMQKWLIERGVPSARVMVDPLGIRTLETMTRAVRVFGVRSAIVCTQSWAAPRAVFLARGSGIDAIALAPRAVSRRVIGPFEDENLKTPLAFVERYFLGRTNTAHFETAALAMRSASR